MATFTNTTDSIPSVTGCKVHCDPSNKEYYFFVKFSNYMNLTNLSMGFATKGSCNAFLAKQDFYKGKNLNDFGSDWANLPTDSIWEEANEEGNYCSPSENLF